MYVLLETPMDTASILFITSDLATAPSRLYHNQCSYINRYKMAAVSIWLAIKWKVVLSTSKEYIAYSNNSDSENANSVIQFQSNGLMEVIWELKLTICLSNGIPL